MTDTTVVPQKTAAQILLETAEKADREHRKEISKAVKDFFDDPKFKDVPQDFLTVAKDEMKAKAVFDPKSHLLAIGKKRMRTPDAWMEKRFPTLLKQAEAPRGDVELQAAQSACESLAVQAELVKSLGAQRTGELMALFGGGIGKISKPMPISDPKKDKNKIADRDNPWGENWNLTKQGQIVKELGEEKAAQLAARVGSRIGATRPTRRSK